MQKKSTVKSTVTQSRPYLYFGRAFYTFKNTNKKQTNKQTNKQKDKSKQTNKEKIKTIY